MPKTSISFRVPETLWDSFRKQADELFLSRAPFLDYMVSRELPELRRELEGLRLSAKARRYISGRVKLTGTTSVNIEVQKETAASLREAVRAHNLVRDAFMSRLLVFLRSNDALLDYLEVPRRAVSKGSGALLEEMPSSPLKAMEAVRDDPLFYIRRHVENRWECGIYRVRLPRSADWAACYLDDEDVPGTRASRARQREDAKHDAMLASLLGLAADVPGSGVGPQVRGKTRRVEPVG